MGSQGGPEDELTVLVTGFGPFREQYPVNPSYEIARRLPAYLPPHSAKDTNARGKMIPDMPPVRVVVHPEPVHVSYKNVRALVPKLWDGAARYDFALHIGMAGPRPFYEIERRAHRTGYKSKDVDDELLEDEQEGGHGEDWIWNNCPDVLESELDMPDVLSRWQEHSPKSADLRISDDAGHYLCDFIYYSSQAHLWKQGRARKLTFLHVPAEATDENVALGTELAINLIRSIAESEVVRRRRGGS